MLNRFGRKISLSSRLRRRMTISGDAITLVQWVNADILSICMTTSAGSKVPSLMFVKREQELAAKSCRPIVASVSTVKMARNRTSKVVLMAGQTGTMSTSQFLTRGYSHTFSTMVG